MNRLFSSKKLTSKINRVSISLFSMFLTLILIWLMLKLSGKYEADALLRTFFYEPFRDINRIREILFLFAPFLLGSLAVLICFRAGFINLNVSGQMAFTGLIVYVVGFFLKEKMPNANWLPLLIVVGILSALFLSLLIAFLRIYFNVNEVLSGIFLNYVVYYIFRGVVQHQLFIDQLTRQETKTDLGSMIGFNFVFGEILSLTLFVSLLIFIFFAFFITYSKFGFQLKMIGQFPTATKYAGIKTNRQILWLFFFSGILSGIAGLFYYYRDINISRLFLEDALPTNGFDTLTIVWLAQSSFVGLPFVALFISLIRVQQSAFLINEVDAQIVEVLIGMMILFVALGNQLYVDPVLRHRFRVWKEKHWDKTASQTHMKQFHKISHHFPSKTTTSVKSIDKKIKKERYRESK